MNTPLTQLEVDERALFLADFRQREGIPAGIPDQMVWANTRAATQFVGWQAGRATLDQSASPAPAGYKLVPIEPTPEMQQAGFDVPGAHMYIASYRAMVAAAPSTWQAAPEAPALRPLSAGLPSPDEHDRVLVYTEGADFAGEQYFDVRTDQFELPLDERREVIQAATHWTPLPRAAATDQPSAGQVDERAAFDKALAASFPDMPAREDGGATNAKFIAFAMFQAGIGYGRASLTPTAPQADPNQRVRDYESGVMQGVAEERAARFARECAAQAAPAVATAEVFALYRAVNELMAHLGAHGEIDARHDLSDAVMAALHGLDGDKVAQRVEDLVEKAFMPRDQATRLAVSEYITCNESTAPQAASQQGAEWGKCQLYRGAPQAATTAIDRYMESSIALDSATDNFYGQAATTASASRHLTVRQAANIAIGEQQGQWEPMGKFAERFVPAPTTPLAPYASEQQANGQWVRCTPDLINAGVSCAKTPRRPGAGSYSHDHFISHAATAASPIGRELVGYFAFHDGEWHQSNVDDPCSVKLYRDGVAGT